VRGGAAPGGRTWHDVEQTAADKVGIKGFARLAIQNAETGALEYDSGWFDNGLTDVGTPTTSVGSSGAGELVAAAYIALATQTAALTSTQDDRAARWWPQGRDVHLRRERHAGGHGVVATNEATAATSARSVFCD